MYKELIGLARHILRMEVHVCKFGRLEETGRLRQQEESVQACINKRRRLMFRFSRLANKFCCSYTLSYWRSGRANTVVQISDEPMQVVARGGRLNAIMRERDLPWIVTYLDFDGNEWYPFYELGTGLSFVKLGDELRTREPLAQGKGSLTKNGTIQDPLGKVDNSSHRKGSL